MREAGDHQVSSLSAAPTSSELNRSLSVLGAGFRDRAPWWGGDLQTVRNQLVAGRTPIPSRSRMLKFSLSDSSGDRLCGTLEKPIVQAVGAPLIVLIHGLTGCEDSTYIKESARFHCARGRTVLRLNLLGAGRGRSIASGYYHAGCARDLRDALAGLDIEEMRNGIFLIGYSLGGNILLNLLATPAPLSSLVGAATVSAPIEPLEACRKLMASRDAVYHRFLLTRMKSDVLASVALSPAERRIIGSARSVYDFDDRWVAPRNGFRDTLDYYERTAGARHLKAIRLPTLLLHAANDPWIPVSSYLAAQENAAENVAVTIARSGGHVGFHERGHAETWHDRIIDQFLTGLPTR